MGSLQVQAVTVCLTVGVFSCDPGEQYPIHYETEHLRIGLESESRYCRGDLEAFERLIHKVEDELSVEMDGVTTVYIWDDDVWGSGPNQHCPTKNSLGCFRPDESTIWTTRFALEHELVHATLGSTDAPPFFQESIADVYGGVQTTFGTTAPTDNIGTSPSTVDTVTGAHFVRWLRERFGPDRLAQILAAQEHSFRDFEAIYGLSLEAAEALYFDDAPWGYPSLYGCDGPQLIRSAGPSWIGAVELDCEDGLDTLSFGWKMAARRQFVVDQPGYYAFSVDADFFELSRCSPARIEEPPGELDSRDDAPAKHATRPSEAYRGYKGRKVHTLHLEAGTHDIAVGLEGHETGNVTVAIWPALTQPASE